MKLTEEQIAAATQARLQSALAHIQRAQDELLHACSALCSLRTASKEYNACQDLHEKVHAFWYRIDGMRNRKGLRLDDANIRAIETGTAVDYFAG